MLKVYKTNLMKPPARKPSSRRLQHGYWANCCILTKLFAKMAHQSNNMVDIMCRIIRCALKY